MRLAEKSPAISARLTKGAFTLCFGVYYVDNNYSWNLILILIKLVVVLSPQITIGLLFLTINGIILYQERIKGEGAYKLSYVYVMVISKNKVCRRSRAKTTI